jgi:hypothetical protein
MLGSIIERKISSFGDVDDDGHYLDSDGNRVNVGNCDANGVNVNNNWDDNRNDNVGLSASRKSPFLCSRELPGVGRAVC